MATRFRRPKANARVCPSCHREKGDRKTPKCARCPGQAIAGVLRDEPVAGVRLAVVDPGIDKSGVAVTSPTQPGVLELCDAESPLGPGPDELARIVLERSARDGAPCWLVIEDPGVGGPRANPEMILSVGQAIGMYRRAWVRAGGRDDRVILVRQVSWQAGVMPGAGARDDRIERSIAFAEDAFGGFASIDGAVAWTEWAKDNACAACLAWFVLRWPEFIERMNERDVEAATRAAGGQHAGAVVDLGRAETQSTSGPLTARSLFG